MKKIKTIKIDATKCTGCRACEMVCSAFHSEPKYSITNPKRSRVRVFWDEDNDLWVPVFASAYTEAECNARNKYIIEGKEYDECGFCGVSCPYRDLFKEPDSSLPLKCDACLQEPPLEEPQCVTWCLNDSLTYEEREEEEEAKAEEKEIGVEYLVKKYGLQEIRNILDRMSKG